jgi:hypothetical protein
VFSRSLGPFRDNEHQPTTAADRTPGPLKVYDPEPLGKELVDAVPHRTSDEPIPMNPT